MKANSTLISRIAQRAKRPDGFTLIELLVVVAIIAILVAILVPALNSARNQAIGAKTVSRMRSLGAGYLLYMADNFTVPLVSQTNANASDAASMWSIQTAIAPYLDLSEAGDRRFASKVWWDGLAELNGDHTQGGGEANLYYTDPPAWSGGPPRNRMTGWNFNYNAHSTYTDSSGNVKAGFTRLNQIAKPSKTALMLSRRNDSSSATYNTWSDGKKYSASNPQSLGAKRLIVYFDGHNETHIITASNYNASGLFNFSN